MNIGIIVSLCAVCIWLIYMLLGRKWFGRPDYRFFKDNYYEQEKLPSKDTSQVIAPPEEIVFADETQDELQTEDNTEKDFEQ